jgi:hypothetical protein
MRLRRQMMLAVLPHCEYQCSFHPEFSPVRDEQRQFTVLLAISPLPLYVRVSETAYRLKARRVSNGVDLGCLIESMRRP